MWRQRLAPCIGTSGLRLGTSGLRFSALVNRGTAPLPLCSYITRGLVVVDLTLGVCPFTCSSRHLTSHPFHSYISSTHSFRPQGPVFYSFLCVLFLFRLRAWGSRTTREVRGQVLGTTCNRARTKSPINNTQTPFT